MATRYHPLLTGKLYVWAEGFDGLNIAQQLSCGKLAQKALSAGKVVMNVAGTVVPLIGLAVGKGSAEELTPVKLELNHASYPLFTCPIVCTTGRVKGLPGNLGHFGAERGRRSQKWVFSFNKELDYWRHQLRLPPILNLGAATFRITNSADKIKTRTEMYKELTQTKSWRR